METPRDSTRELADAGMTETVLPESVTQVDETQDPSASAVRHRLQPRALEGFRIGRFQVLEKVGEGGMGVVFSAYDEQLDRKVAVKLVLASSHEKPRYQRRLLEEARAMAKLEHPNVASVYEVGEYEGGVFVAMEFVRGRTVRKWLEDKPSLEAILDVFVQAGRGLAAAHEAGFVHRDFKPDNCMVGDDGRVRVLDFGLATPQLDYMPAESMALLRSSEVMDMGPAKTVGIAGTPAYMAPEVYAGEATDPASDQFSYCVSLWEALWGQRPFAGGSLTKLVSAASAGEIRDVSSEGRGGNRIPAWIRRAIKRGLSAKPEQRWPSMRELLDTLEHGDPRAAMRRRWLTAGAVALVAASVLGMKVHENRREAARVAACEAHRGDIELSDAQASKIRNAIQATEASDAAKIAEEATTTFAAYAVAWGELRAQTCLRQDIDEELRRRTVDCLARERARYEATLTSLESVEEGMVTRIEGTLSAFENVEACSDEAALRRIPAWPPEAEKREAIRELELALSRTMVDEHFGTYAQGLETSKALVERARKLDYLPVLATAHYREAVFHEKLGSYDEAVELWALSVRESLLSSYEDLAADGAMALAFTEGYQKAKYDTGIRWAELAGVYLERTDQHQGLKEGKRLDVLAVLLEMRGDLEASAATHERALELRRASVGPRHHSIAYGLVNYSYVADKLGQEARAMQMVTEAHSIFEEHYGPDNPTTAQVLHSLAQRQLDMGQLEAAEANFAKVRVVWEKTLGVEHQMFGGLLASLGELREKQERWAEAEALRREGLEIQRKGLGEDHPKVVNAEIQLAQVLVRLERFDEAAALYRGVLEQPKADGGHLGDAWYGLGQLAEQRDDSDDAKSAYTKAKSAYEGAKGDWNDQLARCDAALKRLG